jgi:hypothetical protein
MVGEYTYWPHAHHSRLQVVTALSLISIHYKSPQYLLSFLFQPAMSSLVVPWQRFLTLGDSWASRAQVLSSHPPVHNSALSWLLPGWRPFHTNLLVLISEADFQRNLFVTASRIELTWSHSCNKGYCSRPYRLRTALPNCWLKIDWVRSCYDLQSVGQSVLE